MSTPAKNNPAAGKITIRGTRRPPDTDEQLPSFEVHVQVELAGHLVAWTMCLLFGAQVPIQLDEGQQVTLIAHDELLIDSSRAGTHAIVLLEEESDGQE
jgi:hypothetical protein